MAIIKCKMCGGDLEVASGVTVAECEYCGTKQTLPKVNEEVIQNLFNRANALRLKCEFDKAEQIYEKILQVNNAESEAHWGIVLCKYGIEYVEDPKTYTRIPTCHRTSYDAVTADADYLAAIAHADISQRSIYEAEAKAIDEIQKNILSIVKDEKPFDVFLCYKQTDESGKRTVDSAIANEIYYQLTQEGLKVFYAAITLEDKLGREYEPYIFSALNSAKVMLVIGTKPQYFTSVWVKNEWSRFLKRMKTDRSKLLIPCYKDMDAYELPDEFAHLQAQDMSKIGFINDVVRGIRKVTAPDAPQPVTAMIQQATYTQEIAPLLRRIELFLEDGEFDRADAFCEQVLNVDPENTVAYIGKLQVEFQCCTRDSLSLLTKPISDSKNYKKILRFGTEEEIAFITRVNRQIEENNQIRNAQINKASESQIKHDYKNDNLVVDDFLDVLCPYCNKISSYPPFMLLQKAVPCTACNRQVDYTRHISNIKNISNLDELTALASYCTEQEELKAGDCIVFGTYWQDGMSEKEDIEWLVLAVEDCKAFLVSNQALDCKKYNENHTVVTWEDCTLREWLNTEFFNSVFTLEEKEMIATTTVNAHQNPDVVTNPGSTTQDKVFLLSIEEVRKYFGSDNDRICAPTEYAVERGAWISGEGNCFWWLRTPGNVQDSAAGVDENGAVDLTGDYVHAEDYAVRPAMWIDLSGLS